MKRVGVKKGERQVKRGKGAVGLSREDPEGDINTGSECEEGEEEGI